MRRAARIISVVPVLALLSSIACGASREDLIDPGSGATVAIVRVVAPSPRMVVGGALHFIAQAFDAAGRRIGGRAVRWSTSNAGVATVDSAGMVRGIAAGTVIVAAQIADVVGSTSIEIQPPIEPEITPSGTLTLEDSFDRYTSIAGASPTLSGTYALRGTVQLITGRDGNGKALRFPYSTVSDDNLIEKQFQTLSPIAVSFWYRTSVNADPTCGGSNPSGMKWLMLWRANGPRYTNGVGDLDNGGPGAPQSFLEFTTHDNSSERQPNPFLQNVAKVPKFGTTNDGRWHRYTLRAVQGAGGYEQIWIDGTLVLDNRAQAYDHSAEGINMIQLPGLMVSGVSPGCDWTLDIDDLKVWRP